MRKSMILGLTLTVLATNSWAVKLSDYKPFNFEVLFTNPECATYHYDRSVTANSGQTLSSKPDDVYCKPSDENASVSRPNAPQYRLRQWIGDANTRELYLAYLSFSSKNVAASLCDALKRGVKVTMVLDGDAEKEPNKDAEALKSCGPIKVYYRGSTGGLGYAHNKIMIVNPGEAVTKIVYSSGNLTSGTSTNHENWNFITTSGNSYFAGAHKCVIESMIAGGDTKPNFKDTLNACRALIRAPQEDDIRVYFSPVDGREALNMVKIAGEQAELIEAMSHRFSGELAKLYASLLAKGKKIRFILDDDIYWANLLRKDVGRNTSFEAFKLYNDLITKGMETRFLQTNQQVFQLQHNKIMVFTFSGGGSVFNGAGNFTTAAFTDNFENFYYITIPSVVEAYKKQYHKYFFEMATAPENMPRDYVLP